MSRILDEMCEEVAHNDAVKFARKLLALGTMSAEQIADLTEMPPQSDSRVKIPPNIIFFVIFGGAFYFYLSFLLRLRNPAADTAAAAAISTARGSALVYS